MNQGCLKGVVNEGQIQDSFKGGSVQLLSAKGWCKCLDVHDVFPLFIMFLGSPKSGAFLTARDQFNNMLLDYLSKN